MAGRLHYLSSAIANQLTSSFDLNNCFNKGYKTYFIYVSLFDASTNGGYMGARFFDSSDSIISSSEYSYMGVHMKDYGTYDETWQSGSGNQNQIAPITVGSNDDQRGGGAVIKVYNPDDASSYTYLGAESTTYMDSGMEASRCFGVHKNSEVITGIRLAIQSTTFQMKADVYGVMQ